MAVHFELMPLTAYRRPQRTNPRRWVEGSLAAAGAAAGAAALGRRLVAGRR